MIFRVYELLLPKPATDANALRGALGKALYGSPHYTRLFAPEAPPNAPSGYRNPPRPFALRPHAINVFSTARDASIIASALGFAEASVRMFEFDLSRPAPASSLRVTFKSPTLLKGATTPEFRVLFARARDRVSTLRSFYGEGALPLDFRALGELARGVEMTRCEIETHELSRRSGSTGQVHSIGGFTGFAEYEGELSRFTAILRAAEYTGVGSKTAWGNGWISVSNALHDVAETGSDAISSSYNE